MTQEAPITVAEFNSATDTNPKPRVLDWTALCLLLTRHEPRAAKDGPCWSPVSYLPGRTRGNAGVESVSCLVVDIDDGTPAADLWDGWRTPDGRPLAWCLHSSYSSTPERPKYRVVFPLAAPLPAADWPAVHRKMTLALAGDHADPACKDAARLYFRPSCPPAALETAFADVREGEPLDPAAFPDPDIADVAEAQMRRAFRDGPPRPVGGKGAGGGKPGDDFNARGDARSLLLAHGWQDVRERGGVTFLRRPGKTADYSATFGYGSKPIFHCFTSSAPPFEANETYSPFGVFAVLECGGNFPEAARQLRRQGYGEPPAQDGTSQNASQGEWEPPLPFTAYALPAFPLEALPDALAGFVSEVAASVQVPLDMPALLGIGVIGAAASRSCRVQIGRTHAEPLNLYVAVTAEPGERKSGTMEAMTAVLRDAEREMVTRAGPEIEQAQEQQKMHEKRVAHLQDVATKGKGDAAAAARTELAELRASPAEKVPALPRLLADDVTPEKLAELMAEQGGTLTIASAEGGIFGILAGRYSDGKANLDLFLKAHAGEEVRVDRKGSASVYIPSACLTLLLAVQPNVLSSLADTPEFRGRGFVGRFLYALPQTLVGGRMYQDRPVNAADRGRYTRAVRAMLDLPAAATPSQPGARHDLRIAGAALGVWKEYADEIERRQSPGGDLAELSDWASKLAGAVARIAGGFHLVENAGQGCPWAVPISEANVERAWVVGEYLTEHAQAAYGQMQMSPGAALARRLLRWMDRTAQTAFTLREAHRAHQNVSGVISVQDLVPALSLLCERGYLREQPAKPTGGRPSSPAYEVNPALHRKA